MERLYFMVTADELEWPIAVGRTIEELAIISGKSKQALKGKIRSQNNGAKIRNYKVEIVEVEE